MVETITNVDGVNVFTADDQSKIELATLSTGGYVAVWQSENESGTGGISLVAQVYSEFGQRVGDPEVIVDTGVSSNAEIASVAGLENGNFAVSWAQNSVGQFTQVFDQDALAVSPPVEVAPIITTPYDTATVALPGGGFIVTFADYSTSNATFTIRAQRVNDDGSLNGASFALSPETAGTNEYFADSVVLPSGPLITTYLEGSDLFVVTAATDGSSVGTPVNLTTSSSVRFESPSITVRSDGGYVVTWSENGRDASGLGVIAQSFDATGTALGPSFVVNQVASGNQVLPDVTAISDGGFLVTWNATSEANILARAFDADGTPRGDEFNLVDETTTGFVRASSVIQLDNGLIVTAYEGTGNRGDGDDRGVNQILLAEDGDSFVLPEAPVVEGLAPSFTVSEDDVNGGGVRLDTNGAAAVSGAADFDGGRLIVSHVDAPDTTGQNNGIVFSRLFEAISVANIGTGAGQVAVSGTAVSFEGTTIGTITADGLAGGDLEITFNAAADAVAIEAVVEALTYQNGSDDPEEDISLAIYLEDGDGGAAAPAVVNITVTPVADAPTPIRDQETLVNSFTAGAQRDSSVAALNDGGWIVAWESTGQDALNSNDRGVYTQRYDANGQALGAEVLVNTQTNGAQYQPEVVGLTGGGWAVTWIDTSNFTEGYIRAQVYDASGAAVGTEIVVPTNGSTSNFEPDIAARSDGGFTIIWEGPAANGYIRAQSFDSVGAKIGAEIAVNTANTLFQYQTAIDTFPGGGFVAVWSQFGSTTSYDILARVFDASGNPLTGEVVVNTDVRNSEDDAAVTVLSDGRFVVTWTAGSSQDGSSDGVFAQVMDASGAKIGPELQVNETTSSQQYLSDITALDDGGFAVTWTSFEPNTYDVFVQFYAANGDRVDSQIKVNDITAGTQSDPSIDTLANGDVILTWTDSNASDGSGEGVYQRIVGNPANYADAENEPKLEIAYSAVTFAESDVNGTAQLLIPAAGVSDIDSSDFDGGVLRITPVVNNSFFSRFAPNDDNSQDQISLDTSGSVSISGTSVSVAGTVVGELTDDGFAGEFSITFNANADAQTVETILQAITYENLSDDPEETRDFRVELSDGDGGLSVRSLVTVEITPSVDATVPVSGEVQTNTYTFQSQDNADIAVLADGGWVIVWESDAQDVDTRSDIFGQRYAADGQPVGSEFMVNSLVNSSSQTLPAVTALSDGGWAVVWTDTFDQGVNAQIYNSDGSVRVSDFNVETATTASQTDAEIVSYDGGFAVVWTDTGDFQGGDIKLQRFENSGATDGAEIRINADIANGQTQPSVASDVDGNLVIVWTDNVQDGIGSGIYANRVAADNTISNVVDELVPTVTEGTQIAPTVATLNDGRYVVAWTDYGGLDGSGYSVQGQLFASDGTPIGGQFLVNDLVFSTQYEPDIAALADGGFAISYRDDGGNDGSGAGVFVQEFNADGSRRDGAQQINEEFSSSQFDAHIAATNTGFVAVWSSTTSAGAGDGSSIGIFHRAFGDGSTPVSANARPVLNELEASVDLAGDDDGASTFVPVQLVDDNVTLSDTDSGFANGSLLVKVEGDGSSADDQLSVVAGQGVTVSGSDISFDGTIVGTVDATRDGVNGNDLQINFNAAMTTVAAEAVASQIGYGSTTFSNFLDRELTYVVTDADGATSEGRTISVEHRTSVSPSTLILDDLDTSLEVSEEDVESQPIILDGSVDLTANGPGFGGGFVEASLVGASLDDLQETLGVANQGTGAGQISVSGTQVSFEGTVIGEINATDTGLNGADLRIDLLIAATEASVEALIEALSYQNTAAEAGFQQRVRIQIEDANGTSSNFNDILVNVVDGDDGALGPIGTDTVANTFTESQQYQPAVAALADGGYVAVWSSYLAGNTFTYQIMGQRFDSEGSPTGGEFQISDRNAANNNDAQVTGLADGSFVTTWTSNSDVYARITASDGSQGETFLVNDQISSTQTEPEITALSNGTFIVVWQSQTSAGAGDGNGLGVVGRIFNADGTPVSDTAGTDDIVLNQTILGTQQNPAVAANGAGGFVAVWNDEQVDDVRFQRFDAAGQAVGTETIVSTVPNSSTGGFPDVVTLSDGGFVVVFQDADFSGSGVFQQRYDASGNAVGDKVQVNQYTSSTQDQAQVAATNDGGWVVTWDSSGRDGSGEAVMARAFDVSGDPVGDEFVVNTRTLSSQSDPAIATLNDGRLAVVWVDNGLNGQDIVTGLVGNPETQKLSDAPVLTGLEPVTLNEADVQAGPIAVLSPETVAVGDLDSTDFEGGRLTLSLTDQFDPRTQVGGIDGIQQNNLDFTSATVSVAGNTVIVDGVAIGDLVSDGQGGADLEILFNASATPDRVETLLDSVSYSNPSDDPDETRSYTLTLSDGEGGTSARQDIVISVIPEIDAIAPVDSDPVVNAQTINTQENPAIAGLANGGHVLVWQSLGQDNPGANDHGVFGQLYDSNGQPTGVEFQVNTSFVSTQYRPDVVGLSDGSFVVAWEGSGAQSTGIYAQRFDANGEALGGEFAVNDTNRSEQIVQLAANDTGFAAVWYSSNDIYFKSYDNAGNALTTNVDLSTAVNFSETQPAITALNDGNYVVTYVYNSTASVDGSSNGVFAQIVDENGSSVVGEFLVNTTTLNSQSLPKITTLVDGNFVITWVGGSGQDSSSNGVYAQIFAEDGTPVGTEFLVNEIVAGSQTNPDIAALENGGFVITFDDNSGQIDNSSTGILAQEYNAAGNRIDGPTLVAVDTNSSQLDSTVTGLSGGGFAVGFATNAFGTTDIAQRIFGDAGDYNVAGRPVIEGFNATRVFDENDINGTPQLLDANAAVALSDIDSSDFDGGFLRVDNVVAERGFTDQFNSPDDLTQDQLGLLAANGVTVSGGDVSVDGVIVGAITSNGAGGAPLVVTLNANADVESVERLIENISYRNASDDPSPTRLIQIQVADGDGGVSDPVNVQVEINAEFDGVTPEFTERQANSTTDNDQSDPAIAKTSEGFVIVWQSYNQEDSVANTYGIYGQRFDSNGNPIDGEFQVSTTEAGSQVDPQVVGLTAGGFVVVWRDPNTPDGQDIFLQRYNADGSTDGAETRVNLFGGSTEQDPEIIELSDGNLLVGWESFNNTADGGSSYDIYVQVLDGATGAKIGTEFRVNEAVVSNQQDVSLAALDDGGFVASYTTDDASIDGSSRAVVARQFTVGASGLEPAAAEFLVNDIASSSQDNSSVAVLNDGKIIIVWQSNVQDGSGNGVFGQLFDSAGSQIGQEFRVNDNRLGQQNDPEVIALSTGGFVVTFSDSFGIDGSGVGVFLQQYDAQGNRIDGQLQVNTEFSSTQNQAEVADLGDGTFAVTYHSVTSSTAGDGSSGGIFYQLFDQVDPPISDFEVSVAEDTALTIELAEFDDAIDGDIETVRIDVLPATGQLLLNGAAVAAGEVITEAQISNGDLTYVPSANFNGFDSFFWSGSTNGVTYTLVETEGTIEVTPVNDAVDLAGQPDVSIVEANFNNLSIPLAIGDPDTGDTYTITVDYGEGAPVVVFNTGSKTPFLQNSYEEEGTYTVSVTVDDNAGSVEAINFEVTVENAPPTARDDFYITDEDTPIVDGVSVLNDDFDQAGDTFAITSINGVPFVADDPVILPSGATLILAEDGTISYDPTTSASLQALTDNEITDDSFTYTITDEDGATDTATVVVRVTGEDDLSAQDDALTIDENTLLTGSLFADNGNGADTDPEGDGFVVTAINGQPALTGAPVVLSGGGVLVVQADGSFTFDPRGQYEELGVGETRNVSFTYLVTEDGEGDTADATATITITGVNDAPIAGDNLIAVDFETASGEVFILNNDFDPDGDTLTIGSIDQPDNGTVVVVADTRIIYTPDDGFFGEETITYTVTDGNGGSDTATITLRVAQPPNEPPVAVDDTVQTDEDTRGTFDVLANDSDLDLDVLTLLSLTQPANGSAFISGNQIVFDPDADFNGQTSLTYSVSDGVNPPEQATVTINVTPVNDDPDGVAETIVLTEDTGTTGNVLTNDDDVDGDTLSVSEINGTDLASVDEDAVTPGTQVTLAGGAILTIGADGGFAIDPGANYQSLDDGESAGESFTYTVSDGQGGSDLVSVDVTISGANDAPVGTDDEYAVDFGETLSVTAAGGVLANDTDVDLEGLTATLVDNASNGDVTLELDGSFTYVPVSNFSGQDSFTYRANDGDLDSQLVTVTLDVAAPPADGSISGRLFTDTDGDNLDVGEAEPGIGGIEVFLFSGDGLTELDSTETDSFGRYSFADLVTGTYQIVVPTDIAGEGLVLQDQGADDTIDSDADPVTGIIVNVGATFDQAVTDVDAGYTQPNRAPVGEDASETVDEDNPLTGTLVATDLDGDTLTFALDVDATNGSVEVQADGSYEYTPDADYNGSDSFTYTVSDGNGGSDGGTITITVDPVNDDPVAADADVSGDEDTVISGSATATDVDGDTLTYALDVDASNGSVDMQADGSYDYTPNADYNGSDSFTYTVSDGNGGTDSGTISITVDAVNDDPVAEDADATGDEDTTITGTLAATDVDGDDLTFALEGDANNGSVTVDPDGSYEYVPDPDYNGPDSFTYTVSDGNGGTDIGTISITVDPVNDDPDASAAAVSGDEDMVIGAAVTATDVDGDSLTYALDVDALNGSVDMQADGSYTYTPNADYNGLDSFTYTVSDGNGGTDSETISITINPVNDDPIAMDDSESVLAGATVTVDVLDNDTDIDGDTLTLQSIASVDPAVGTATIVDDALVFTAAADTTGTVDIDYTVSDGQGGSATATAQIVVSDQPNADPEANDASLSGDEDTEITGTLTATDSDGDLLVYALANGPTNGTVNVNLDGSFSYLGDQDFNGDDSFTFIVDDGRGGTDTGTVQLTVDPVNDAPVVDTNDVTISEDDVIAFFDLLAGASDVDNDVLSLDGVTFTASDGRAVVAPVDGNGVATFDPNQFNDLAEGEEAVVTVNFGVTDGTVTTLASFEITVEGANDLPAALDADFGSISEDDALLMLDLSTLVQDPDVSDTTTFSSLTASWSGGSLTASLDADGMFSFDPDQLGAELDSGEDAEVSFTFETTDGLETVSHAASLTVTGEDDVAGPLFVIGTEDSDVLNGTDADEIIFGLGGRLDRMDSGGGADTFVFGAELSNGVRERDFISNFDVQLDTLLFANDNYTIRDTRSGVYIVHGDDNDRIYVNGNGVTKDDIVIDIGTIDFA